MKKSLIILCFCLGVLQLTTAESEETKEQETTTEPNKDVEVLYQSQNSQMNGLPPQWRYMPYNFPQQGRKSEPYTTSPYSSQYYNTESSYNQYNPNSYSRSYSYAYNYPSQTQTMQTFPSNYQYQRRYQTSPSSNNAGNIALGAAKVAGKSAASYVAQALGFQASQTNINTPKAIEYQDVSPYGGVSQYQTGVREVSSYNNNNGYNNNWGYNYNYNQNQNQPRSWRTYGTNYYYPSQNMNQNQYQYQWQWSGNSPSNNVVDMSSSKVKSVNANDQAVVSDSYISSWTSGSPTWKKSFTPIRGQPGCFNKCRPSCRSQYPTGYGCKPSCRQSCRQQPTCGGSSSNQQWYNGNTLVCGRQGNAGLSGGFGGIGGSGGFAGNYPGSIGAIGYNPEFPNQSKSVQASSIEQDSNADDTSDDEVSNF